MLGGVQAQAFDSKGETISDDQDLHYSTDGSFMGYINQTCTCFPKSKQLIRVSKLSALFFLE